MSLFAGRVWASHSVWYSVIPALSLKGRVFLLRWDSIAGVVVGLLLASSGVQAQDSPIRVLDDAGRVVQLGSSPQRIVSLVPVATEILFGLGEGRRLVGRSRYDDYPLEVLAVPDVGDAIRPSIETVLLRDPDLVILIGGSDNAQAAREMARLDVPFVSLLFNTLDDLHTNVLRLGRLVGRSHEAFEMWERIERDLDEVRIAVEGSPRPRVFYDVGYPPAFTVGAGSYLDTLIAIAGGSNVFGDLSAPSPRVSLEAIMGRDPDIIIHPVSDGVAAGGVLPSERPGWSYLRAVRSGSVRTVPADLLHRLGPRIGEAARLLAIALHPETKDLLLP